MSSRSTKKAALAKIRAAKRKRDLGEEDDLFDGDIKEEDDVYDTYTEEEYKSLVESRRQREDFVVDDDGLGYYDDGEERLGDENGEHEVKKRSGMANMTAASLRKARKAKEALRATKRRNEVDEEIIGSNRSMWDFVKRGASDNMSSRAASTTVRNAGVSANVDDLLGQLDEVASMPRKKKTRRGKRAPLQRSSFGSARRRSSEYNGSHRRARPVKEEKFESDDDDNFAAFDENDDGSVHDRNGEIEMKVDPEDSKPKDGEMKVETPEKPTDQKNFELVTPGTDQREERAEIAQVKDSEGKVKKEETSDDSDQENDIAPRRRLGAKRLLGGRSMAAQKAAEMEKKAQKKVDETPPKPSTAPLLEPTTVAFTPDDIAAESSTSAAAVASFDAHVVTDGDERYVDFYWLDAAERKGDIYLYGKVASVEEPNQYSSCCLVVKGNKRNLFVLPKKVSDDEYASMVDVHGEMKSILQPRCIPKVLGASWGGKPVEREYAFEDPEVPREKTQYLKVVYDAKYPAPSEDICQNGGEYFHKILNAKASVLETFILKRKLMGPCWIRVRNPEPHKRGTVSWCGFELQVDSPKQLVRLDLAEPAGKSPRAAPPVTTVTLKMKTIVNPQTQKQEVVSVSAICHKQVLLDKASDQSRKFMTQLSLIRPIHLDEASKAQGMARFPRDLDAEINAKMPQLKKMANERALLNMLVAQLGKWDPDVLVGHNAWGFDIQVLLSRCVDHKVKMWSKFGRHRQMTLPNKGQFSKDWGVAQALSGRLLCDTYLSAKEHLRETTYSLKNLAETQLKTSRMEIEPMDTPQYFKKSSTIVNLALHTLNDAQLVQKLMFKLQILPLSKQLTNIAGNLWSTTLKSNRAARTEYLLLHEFHRLKYLVPEKYRSKQQDGSGKAKYAGGLVLEPKKGLYDTFILLLDFNSLYPSLIQEYNLCFTTVNEWASFHQQQVSSGNNDASSDEALPPLPDGGQDTGVLPKVIKSLVQRRRQVKHMMKKESDPQKQEELDIKQKAFKLTANSMYGCLGFSHSRFYAQPIAAMVTSMGRQTLQKTVDIAESTVGLEVIYGDTDSIMINTRISDTKALSNVRKLGEQVKKEVNKLYRTLELEIDGIFKCMLLLKKKKYAAITVDTKKNGELVFDREEKGLDLVRRDWCVQSKDTGRYILEQILSIDQEKDVSIANILNHLEELAKNMRDNEIPLEKYVITKGLSKHPNDYPDGKALPHVHVAKMMIRNNRTLTVGDHIPYVITQPLNESDVKPGKASKSATDRARHPEEISRSGGVLKVDVEWYLTQQILPPVSRLCEPIEGLSHAMLAERLGLDSSKYSHSSALGSGGMSDEVLVDYIPESFKPDKERFQDVRKLNLTCVACRVSSELPGMLHCAKGSIDSGFNCANPACSKPYWGNSTPFECMAKIMNAMSNEIRTCQQEYYRGVTKCDDPACGLETRQLSVTGGVCLRRGCNGRMSPLVTERSMQNQLKYFESLFDMEHIRAQLMKSGFKSTDVDAIKMNDIDNAMIDELCRLSKANVEECDYNWIAPTFWQSMFGSIQAKQ